MKFHYIINTIKLILTLLIQISESNLIRRYQSNKFNNNPTIYVNIGDSINISCLFDPSLIMVNYNGGKNENKNIIDPILFPPPLSMFSNYNFDKKKRRYIDPNHQNRKSKYHHGRGHGSQSKNVENLFQANQKLKGPNENEVEDESPPNEIKDKYELDWYFLDKNGHMNIISYGNQTRSRYKYKTFIMHEQQQDSLLPYGSSALYSQTHSRSAIMNNKNSFTYYLNVLIESEDDEGVYQCINPDLPNFILRNVTVLFEKNGSWRCTVVLYQNFILMIIVYSLVYIY